MKDGVDVNHFGIYRGIVVNNSDPLSGMRMQVQVPGVLGEEVVWAMACVPVGMLGVPDSGTLVWIMFEAGNADFPVWIGTGISES